MSHPIWHFETFSIFTFWCIAAPKNNLVEINLKKYHAISSDKNIMDDICEMTHVAPLLYRKSLLRRRGVAACLNWRWFCINFWPPRSTGAVGTEMIDNYYYLRQEYTRCRISEPGAGGEISLGGRLSRHRGIRVFAASAARLPFLRAILRIVRITWLQRPVNRERAYRELVI